MVPEGWKEFKLEKLVKATQLGTSLRGVIKGEESSGIPLIKMGNLTWGGFNFDKVEVISPKQIDEALLLEHGDFLFNTRNTPKLVGKSAVWDGPKKAATFDNNINRINFNKLASPFFMAYLLNHGTGKAKVQSLPAGSTSVAAIYWKDLKNLKLSLPPLGEQKKIAQVLSTWDKAITTTEQLLANSQKQKKALMQQLLTGKKRLLDENGVRYSGKWINGRLGDLLVFKGGSAFKEKYQGNSVGDLPFIKVSDMNIVGNEKYINRANNWVSQNEATLMKAYPFDENTIVFAKVGAALRLNRRRILATPTIIDNNMMAAIPRQTSDTEFLYQLLLAIDFAKFVQDGAVPSVNQSDLNAFKITYPDFDERQKIAKVLATAEKQSKELKQTLLVLKNEKKALMQQLLTGKRRVKVDEDAA